MDHRERNWLFVLIGVFVLYHVITLSNLVPWQEWRLWSRPEPVESFAIDIKDYEFRFPPGGMEARVGEYVEFVATSQDVTYGFGAFRQDGSMVFQMQVLPGMENRMIWKFDEPGDYDVRSTEYSGPRHSEMYVPDAIRVVP
jgi:cytochrome c oxidase subunit II